MTCWLYLVLLLACHHGWDDLMMLIIFSGQPTFGIAVNRFKTLSA